MTRFSGMQQRTLTFTFFATGSLVAGLLFSTSHSFAQNLKPDLTHPHNDNLIQIFQKNDFQPPPDNGMPGNLAPGGIRAYQPPPYSTGPRRRTVGGTRGGCDGTAAINLTALAPQGHIGQTTATHPTFVWYVPDGEPYPMQLQLYRYTSDAGEQLERVKFFDFEQSQPGFMSFTLPEDEPPLAVGETYRWKVIIFCNPGRPSQVSLDEADLMVVEPPAGLDAAGDPVAVAERYAAAGLWYDAIAALSQEPVSPAAAAYRSKILESLAELEADNPDDSWSLFSERLRYIAEN